MPAARPRWGLARVHGRSMLPTLREGDRLLLDHHRSPTVGDVVVVRLPDGVIAVKRLELYDGSGWWVTRDNPDEGVDSWTLGAPVDAVLAVALARVWPRPRGLRSRPTV